MDTPLEHEWETASRHRSSEGVVVYQHCRCGTRRIRLERALTSDFLLQEGRNGDVLETVAQPFRGRRRPV
ncbi:hypothetical protein SAMN05216207_1014132 [Pseudonocardia ammonioxydans]|uniref:Uncharacterized protein n=1 Tax=Pseudonocardia ammonioxydans TaxID=260086 RepID=A0A1I4Z6U0_PSUAM|nr:hypothetical protein [Pseudonocardia ammonioxydans]SFN45994.1 hypothetical protein SAMN05216207_1014132 [Pseudonocardia ammonioxydans]